MTDDLRRRWLPTPADLQAMMQDGTDLIVLSIQSINPYTSRPSVSDLRIPGAIFAQAYEDFQSRPSAAGGQRPLPAIEALQAAARRWGLRPESTIVVYDDDRSLTAARAWWVLRWAGLPDVRVLDGGLPAWRGAGLPLTSEAPTVTPSSILLSPGHMPEFGPGDAARLAREGVLLDARIRANYIGGPGQPARGHIPGARSAPAPDNVTDYGTFVDSATLREMYAGVGVEGNTPVGVYCGAGMSAAHSVLALAAIGVEAAMYPGSWSAWVGDESRPVARGWRPGG